MKVIPNYHPPQDYRRPTKTQEKVYVPVNDYPEINFSMIANPLTFLTLAHKLPFPCCMTPWIYFRDPAPYHDKIIAHYVFLSTFVHILTRSSLLKLVYSSVLVEIL